MIKIHKYVNSKSITWIFSEIYNGNLEQYVKQKSSVHLYRNLNFMSPMPSHENDKRKVLYKVSWKKRKYFFVFVWLNDIDAKTWDQS
jgi:hypothetical protein